MAQACDDVLARVAHLDLVHEVAFGEHRAARRDVGGFFGGERNLTEFLDLNAQAMRLAREKRPRPGGA